MELHIRIRGDHAYFRTMLRYLGKIKPKSKCQEEAPQLWQRQLAYLMKSRKQFIFSFKNPSRIHPESTLVQCVQTTEYEVDTKAISTA